MLGCHLYLRVEHPLCLCWTIPGLSTDIDIIVSQGTDVDGYIEKAGKIFPFISVEEQKRKGLNNIEKRHFRFHFLSPISGKEINILLDVVVEDNPYSVVFERPIRSSLLTSQGEDMTVVVPDKNSILGDKLTAFAPHTTGIPFGVDKELEIIKQMFDCWTLIQEMDDLTAVSTVYRQISAIEVGYRGIDVSVEDCLKDTIDSCICIMGRGSVRSEEYQHFSRGIGAIQGHIFDGRINGENAGAYASEVMYLATCILTGQVFERITDPNAFRDVYLKAKGIKKISSFRNVNPLAYAYMIKSLQILQEKGLYVDGIL